MFLNLDEKQGDFIAAKSVSGETASYNDIIVFSDEIKKCIGQRMLVFSLCHNRIGSFMGYTAFLSTGNVPLLLNADMELELLKELLVIYQPNYIWAPKEWFATAIQMKVIEGMGLQKLEAFDYVLIPYSSKTVPLHSELALLLTTSGSTGSPKLVRQTYQNIEENAKAIAKYLELDATERPITMLPMNYTYGLSVINSHLLVGATILITEDSYAQRGFWEFFKKEGATSIVGVPFTYEILKKLRFFSMELPSLRYMTQAGGKLLPELHKEFAEYAQKNNKRFYVMYGQTEATARMSYLPYRHSLEKCGSMGIAIPGGRFRLIDSDGSNIELPDTIGELVYEGPNVTPGYAECRDDLIKEDERKGVLFTGDMAKTDADGYYYIVGRKKRFLKIYGNRVNLDECERMIREEYREIEGACVGEDDHMRIFITGKDFIDDVKQFVTKKTGLNAKAFEVQYIESLPKNDSGKILYQELEQYGTAYTGGVSAV